MFFHHFGTNKSTCHLNARVAKVCEAASLNRTHPPPTLSLINHRCRSHSFLLLFCCHCPALSILPFELRERKFGLMAHITYTPAPFLWHYWGRLSIFLRQKNWSNKTSQWKHLAPAVFHRCSSLLHGHSVLFCERQRCEMWFKSPLLAPEAHIIPLWSHAWLHVVKLTKLCRS